MSDNKPQRGVDDGPAAAPPAKRTLHIVCLLLLVAAVLASGLVA